MIAHDFPNFKADDYASHGNAILGIRDSGKTVTAEGLAERLMDAGIPITVIDPIGRWRFLRVPGKGKGYPVVVAGGAEGDLPLNPQNAESLIRAAMQNRISIVFDLYDMDISKADWRRICEAVVRTMLYENKRYGLRHIFIEEAAEFAPQRVQPGQGAVYAEIEKLARMGGNALLGYTLINQRSEEVNKAVLELCDTLILHRQKGRNSLQNLEKWLKVASAKDGAKILESMPMLKQGEAWAWISGSDTPVRIQFPMKQSFAPDRRAITGATVTPIGKSADVGAFITAMKATLDQVDEKPKGAAKGVHIERGPPATDAAYEEGHNAGYEEGYAKGYADGQELGAGVTQDVVGHIRGILKGGLEKLGGIVLPEIHPAAAAENKRHPLRRPSQAPYDPAPRNGADPGVGAELRILRVLAARDPAVFTPAQWATLAGMKRTGGTWRTYVSRLRTQGLIVEDGGHVGLTPAGRRAAGHVERPAAGSVVEGWKQALGTGPAKMIAALVAYHPHAIDQANLADRCGMTVSGGTFRTYLSRLRSNGLVEVHGRKIKASETLFLDRT